MSEVLSPDEIAALVAAAKEGGVPDRQSARPRRVRRVRQFDFTRPVKLAPDQQRRLERAHEAFCRTTATRLSAELRSPVELEVINVDQLTWAGALADVPKPSVFGVVSTHPLDTAVLLCVELPAIFRMIERLIGGGSSESQIARGLTEIELALTRRMVASLVEQLSLVWQELFGLNLTLVELETQMANVQLAPPSEPTVVLTIESCGVDDSSTISLLVPYRAIAPVTNRLRGQFGDAHGGPQRDAEAGEAVRAALGAVGMELRAEVAAIELTIGEVLALGEGDIVRLGVPASTGVALCAGAVPLYRARPGVSGIRRAVEIVERLQGAA